MTNLESDFHKKTNCDKLKLMSKVLEKKLNDYANGIIEFDDIDKSVSGMISGLKNKKYEVPNDDCVSCFDFQFYFKLSCETIENNGNVKNLKEKLQYWEKSKSADSIIYNLPNGQNEFNITNIPLIQSDIFYFDFNIYQQIEDNHFIEQINKKNLTIVYSPIHLEEVSRMKNSIHEKERIDTITAITKDYVVLNMDNALNIYVEKPIESFRRVMKNTSINEAVENNRVIKNKDKNTFFESLQNDKYKYINSSQNIFEIIGKEDLAQLLFFAGCFLSEEEFKKENKTYDEILHRIYSLYDVLDNISFSVDTLKDNARSLRSSVYDIEHLIYASNCNYLLTADKKFYKRANQIYKFLNVNTKVIHIRRDNNLLTFLNSLDDVKDPDGVELHSVSQ